MPRFLLVVMMTVLLAPHGAYASAGGASGGAASGGAASGAASGTTEPPATAACNFEELKNHITQTESSGGGCGYGGSTNSTQGATAGRYQFVPGTWAAMVRGCPNEAQCPHSAVRGNPNCCAAEECAMNNLLASNMNGIRANANCQRILGTTITAPVWGSRGPAASRPTEQCTVTMSGLLAAWHLGGGDACDGPATGGYGDHDGVNGNIGTFEATYICHHGGIAVPNDCTPQQMGDPYQAPPVGTLQQILIQEAQGDLITVSSGRGLLENWVAGLMQMAEQFTAAMIAQMQSLGMLLDAKHQQESQRLFQEKVAEAHKDYQPSEQMCTFGTFTRELAATERSADLTRNSLSTQLMQREINSGDSVATTPVADSLSRIANYRAHFCNQTDNSNGLALLCPTPADPAMQNRDINYTLTVDAPLSLDVNLLDNEITDDERAIFALVDNLFAHQPMPNLPAAAMDQPKYQYHYMNVRSLIAMRGVVRSTIANVIALKTASPQTEDSNAPYLSALFREFGITDAEITLMLGERPSYYAQMELLTKKIYQNPSFYTNLYDKPTNVKRIRAAMTAIKLMQDRDIAASLQRREMLLSLMLELRLRNQAESVYTATERALFDED